MDHQFFEDPLASSLSSLEAEIFAGQLPSPPWPDLELDNDVPELDTPTPNAASSGSGSGSGTHKKLSHNAYERDRRKQLNGLYSSLRALLPEADQTKRLSIPLTVSRVLKYIPELQKQVENLEKKKKELMEVSSRQREGQYMSESTRSPVVSATLLSGQEVMVHISLWSKEASTTLPLSRCIRILESEGLHLINSSTFSTSGNRTFYNLHLQRKQGTISMDGQAAFCENLVNVIKKRAAAGSIGQ